MENPINKMDDMGGKPTISGNTQLVLWSCRPHIECFVPKPLVSVSLTWHGLSKKVREPGFFVAHLGEGFP